MRAVEKKYLIPFCLVTILFALWGLANNMTDTLLSAFKRIMDMSDAQTSLIQSAFYGSYFCFAFPAAIYIRKHSYKGGIILGLLLYSLGTMLFLPAAKAASYAMYLIAIYIMAGGCSVLEVTANPYILSMGDAETATRRLNVAQAFNPIGSIAGILMSKYFILSDISLYSISGTYSILGLAIILVMVIMLIVKMPGGKDSASADGMKAAFLRLARNRTYVFGVVAQFFYVGAQIGVWSFTIRIVMQELGIVEAQAATVYLAAIVGFCISRFIYTWLMKWFRPERLLAFGAAMSAICAVAVPLLSGCGWIMVIFLVAISFFMSLMFPTIYGTALAGVSAGEHPDDMRLGGSGLVMAILGGAVLTPVQGLISDAWGIYLSYLVPAVCFLVVLWYALYLTRKTI